MPETPHCAEVRDLIPELAAGVASGDERARALAHLADCARCRQELEDAAEVVDDLVLLAPEHEPSPGFETRVLAALAPRPARRTHRVPVLLMRAAAVVLVAVLSAGLTWWHTRDDRALASRYRQTLAVADGRYLTAAAVSTPTGAEAGHLFAYQGSPSWIFVTLTAAPESGTYTIQLVTRDKRTIRGGTCTVTNGAGYYGTAIKLPVSDIERVELLKAGSVAMSAYLR
jgi:Putative zinc-finger